MFIPKIRFNPTREGPQIPLFMVQMPQKTFNRLGLGARAWERFLFYCLGIDCREADLLNTFIDLKTYSQILTLGMRVCGSEKLLRWYVEDTGPSDLGPVGIAVCHAPTVGDGFDVWLKYSGVMAPNVVPSYTDTLQERILQIHQREDLGHAHGLYRELGIFLAWRKLLDLSGGKANIRLRFGSAPLLPLQWYQDTFGVKPEVGHQDALVISHDSLLLENDAYLPLIYQRALQECEQVLLNLKQQHLIRHRVRTLLVEGIQHFRFYNLDQVADALNMSVRTLTRRLQDECSSFRDIQSEVRLEIAKFQLLSTRLPIKAICANAGFTNMSAFSRAFRRYTQLSPSDFRQNV